VDDEEGMPEAMGRVCRRLGCEVRIARSFAEGKRLLQEARSHFLFADFWLQDGIGPDLVRWALSEKRAGVAFCITGSAHCTNVVEAMRAGCSDVLEKPVNMARVTEIVNAYRAHNSGDLDDWRRKFAPEIIGQDPALLQALRLVRRVADTNSTVLITGQSGTGKEEIAATLHRASSRASHGFVALNCAAIPENLIEAELFGHARGAFTGATHAREGRIAAAEGGTLFLDEIGDMPLAAQAKLLRVLQERTMIPIGSDRPVNINIRVVAATNKDLEEEVAAGRFRLDLLYRLNVIAIELPSLSERPDDIVLLANYLLQRAVGSGRTAPTLDESAEDALCAHHWPGNIRELANTLERAMLMANGNRLGVEDFQFKGRKRSTTPTRPIAVVAQPQPVAQSLGDSTNLKAALDEVERRMIGEALARTNGNRTEAAALLGLNRSTLTEKLRRLIPNQPNNDG